MDRQAASPLSISMHSLVLQRTPARHLPCVSRCINTASQPGSVARLYFLGSPTGAPHLFAPGCAGSRLGAVFRVDLVLPSPLKTRAYTHLSRPRDHGSLGTTMGKRPSSGEGATQFTHLPSPAQLPHLAALSTTELTEMPRSTTRQRQC